MGIDFTWKGEKADDRTASWSYSGFGDFRRKLSEEVGLNLDEMEGFGGDRPWKLKDPIVKLLNHSDCDGELSPEDCLEVAPRLRELVKDWEDSYGKQQALLLADNMESAAMNETPLIFT